MKLHYRCTLIATFFSLAACSAKTTIVTQNAADSGSSSGDTDSGTEDTDSGTATDSGSKVDAGEAQLPGNAAAPTSCNAVCTAASRTCDPNYNWGTDLNGSTDGTAGGEATYQAPDKSYALYAVGCTTAPTATQDFGDGTIGTLEDYYCACK